MTNLNEMKTKELKEMAKELKVKNWWTLKKTELINEIAIAIADKEDENEDVNVDQIAQDAIETANDESINEAEEATQNEPETTEEKPKKQRGKDLIEWNGKTQNLSQWAKELGMPGQTLFARIHLSNWSVEKAFTTPVKKRNKKEV
jgi:hypothetical protein